MSYLKLVLTWHGRTKLIDDSRKPEPRFKGLIHGTTMILKEEGIGGVYRGLFPVVSHSMSSIVRMLMFGSGNEAKCQLSGKILDI